MKIKYLIEELKKLDQEKDIKIAKYDLMCDIYRVNECIELKEVDEKIIVDAKTDYLLL